MTYEEYQKLVMIKRKLRAMFEAGRIHDYIVAGKVKGKIQLIIQYRVGHPWIRYTLESFLKHLRKGHIDNLANNLKGAA